MKKTWTGTLSLDLRDETLAKNKPGMDVIDSREMLVMTIMPDECGRFDHTADIVETLNLAAAPR